MKYHYSLGSVVFSILPSGGAYSPCLRLLLDPAQPCKRCLSQHSEQTPNQSKTSCLCRIPSYQPVEKLTKQGIMAS